MPRFSVVIPTKDRSELVAIAIASVRRQSCEDWELVISDNSDDDSTRAVVDALPGDARVRYFRSGGLSMPDNWEFAISKAEGEYLCLLEDKQALHFDAFERLSRVIDEGDRPEVVRWEWDTITSYGLGHRVRRCRGGGEVTRRSPDEALRAVIDGTYLEGKALLPIPHYSAIRADLLDRIRAGPVGRLCPPVSPDYTLAIQVVSVCDELTYLDASLVAFSDVSVSNGVSLRMKTSLGKTFAKQLGDPSVFYSHVPVKARTISGSIYNDYVALRDKIGGRLEAFPPNWVAYYFGVHESLESSRELGVDMSEEQSAFDEAFAREPEELQRQVRERIARDVQRRSKLGRRIRRVPLVKSVTRGAKSLLHGRVLRDPEWRYDNILDYLEWRAGQPRA